MTITLTATMFNRTIVTEHATLAEARQRVLDIATAQQCTIEGDELTGTFAPTTSRLGSEGTYVIEVDRFTAGQTVKLAREMPAGHWAHELRGHVVRADAGEALVRWDYEALGGEWLAPYWILNGEIVPA